MKEVDQRHQTKETAHGKAQRWERAWLLTLDLGERAEQGRGWKEPGELNCWGWRIHPMEHREGAGQSQEDGKGGYAQGLPHHRP